MPVVVNWAEQLFDSHGSKNAAISIPPEAKCCSPHSSVHDPMTPISPSIYRPPSNKIIGNPSKLTNVGLRACLVNTLNITATDLRKQICSPTNVTRLRKQVLRQLCSQNFALLDTLTSTGRTVAVKRENHEQYLAAARSYLSMLLNVKALQQYQTQQLPPILPHECAAYYAEQVYAHAAVFIRDTSTHPLWKQSARGVELRNVLERYHEKLANMLFSLMHGTVVALEPKYGRILQRKMQTYYKQREKQENDQKPRFQQPKPPPREPRPSDYFRKLDVLPMQPEQLRSRYWNRQMLCKLSEFTARWMLYCCLPKEQLRELERALNSLYGPVVTSTLHYTLIPDEKMYEEMRRDKRKLEIALRGLPNEVIQQAVGKFREALYKFYDDSAMKSIARDADDDLVMRRTSVVVGMGVKKYTQQLSNGASKTRNSSKKAVDAVQNHQSGHEQNTNDSEERNKAPHNVTLDVHKTSPLYTRLLVEGKAQTQKPDELELPDQADELIELKNGQMFRKVMVPVYPQNQQNQPQPSSHEDSSLNAVAESRSINICRPVKMGRHRDSSSSEDDDEEKHEKKRIRRNNENEVKRPVQPHDVGYRRWTEVPHPLRKHYFTELKTTSEKKSQPFSVGNKLSTLPPKKTEAKTPAKKNTLQYDEHARILFITMREWAQQIGLVSLILEQEVEYTVWPAALLRMLTDFNISKRIMACLLLLHLRPIDPEELLAVAAADSSSSGGLVTADFVRKCQRHVEKWRAGRAKYIEALRFIVDDFRENEQVRKAATMALIFENHTQQINNSARETRPHNLQPRYANCASEIQVLLNMLCATSRPDRVAACVFLAFCRIRTERIVHELGFWLFSTSTNKAVSEQPSSVALTTRKIIQYACAQVGQYDSRMVTVIFSGVSSFHYEKRITALESLPLVVCASSFSAQFFPYDMKLHIAMLCLTEKHPQVKQRACWAVNKLGLGQLLHCVIAQTLQCRARPVKTFPVGSVKANKVDSFTKLAGIAALNVVDNGSVALTGDVIETILAALSDPSHIIRLEAIKTVALNPSFNQSLLEEICETAQFDTLEVVRDAAVKALLRMPDALAQSCVRTALLFMVRFEDSAVTRNKIVERLLHEPLYAGASDFYDVLRKKMFAAESTEVCERLKSAINLMEEKFSELKATHVMENNKSDDANAFVQAGADENIAQLVKANLNGYVAQQHLKQIMCRVACKMRDKKHEEFRQLFVRNHFRSKSQSSSDIAVRKNLDQFFNELGNAVNDDKKKTMTKKTNENRPSEAECLLKYVQTTVNPHKHYGVRRSSPIIIPGDRKEPLVKHWVNKYEIDESGRLTVKDDWKLQHVTSKS